MLRPSPTTLRKSVWEAWCNMCCLPLRPVLQREEMLADYGFTCGCDKCCAERLAAELLLG